PWSSLAVLISPPQTFCGFALTPIQLAPVPCNDKAVEKLSRLAITYINEDRTDGYKFALNRVANVHLHAQGPAGNVYYLDLDVLETKCHIGSLKPWKRCEVRPFMETRISGNCNTTILHTPEGYSYLYSYDCTLVPDPPEKLQQICPTCPLLLPVDSQQAVNAARIAMATYKRQSTLGAELGVSSRLLVHSFIGYLFVLFSFAFCSLLGCLHPKKKLTKCLIFSFQTAGFCAGSVLGDFDPDVQVSCEMFGPINPVPIHPVPINPVPIHPVPSDPVPSDPSVAVNPYHPIVSSSESAEAAGPSDSSSEEIGGIVALRPPFDFRYQRRDRKKRQALLTTLPSHKPVFLSDFPSGLSPFRSCPGPFRYTTV
uniref:Cystatin fetuin-B-type domain-containing protein n=1 Tax=Mola mola TaxID=94237 RepID=A0A3Q3VLP4_MOLML